LSALGEVERAFRHSRALVRDAPAGSRPSALDRANAAFADSRASRSLFNSPLTFNEYSNFFNFAGLAYPIIQTTLGSIDRERVAMSGVGAYKASGPVASLVFARVQAFAQPRFQWTRFNGSKPGPLFGTPDLKVLERPWGPSSTTADLLARMEVDASLAGNSYTFKVRPGKLSRLRPEFVTIILGSETDSEHPQDAPDVEVAAYLYTPPSGEQKLYFPEQVCHYAPLPDPYYHFLGMSWLTPVIRELQGDTLATEHKLRFFENAATPNLAIKFDPTIDIDKVRQFRDLLEEDHAGAFNAWKTLYLGGGADPVTVGLNFQQMDYSVMQGRAESRLASAAGVPPSWVGFAEGLQGSSLNAGNFTSARRRFTDGTLEHLWTNAASSMEAIVSPPPGANLYLDRNVPVTRDDAQDVAAIRMQESQMISQLIMQGFDPDSVVKAVAGGGDWTQLEHTGLTSVQLSPPSEGTLPTQGKPPKPPLEFDEYQPAGGASSANGNGKAPSL
jgi:phage portal protein BeeE